MTNPTIVTETEKFALGGSLRIEPHPDGKPWAKCCQGGDSSTQCQCFMRKPTHAKSRYDKSWAIKQIFQQLIAEGGRFFCIHRTEDGYHRECAGWFAKFRSKQDHNAHVIAFRDLNRPRRLKSLESAKADLERNGGLQVTGQVAK